MTALPRVEATLREQQRLCAGVRGSPIYATLLAGLADAVRDGDPRMTKLLERHESDPPGSALALRLLAGLHRLVLSGDAPALARHYPTAGGTPDDATLVEDALRTLDARRADLADRIPQPLQTNEVGRSAVLFGGFLVLASRYGFALRLLEVGASAGLNLLWDRYRYATPHGSWGPSSATVRFDDVFDAGSPPLDASVQIRSRRGSDLAPLDLSNPEDALTLRSAVWPDHQARHERLAAAIDVARTAPPVVERAAAAEWTGGVFAPEPDTCTVLFHSIVMPYLDEDERQRFEIAIESCARQATPQAPVAHLAFEHRTCGNECHPVLVCDQCGDALTARDVRATAGPGATVA